MPRATKQATLVVSALHARTHFGKVPARDWRAEPFTRNRETWHAESDPSERARVLPPRPNLESWRRSARSQTQGHAYTLFPRDWSGHSSSAREKAQAL